MNSVSLPTLARHLVALVVRAERVLEQDALRTRFLTGKDEYEFFYTWYILYCRIREALDALATAEVSRIAKAHDNLLAAYSPAL